MASLMCAVQLQSVLLVLPCILIDDTCHLQQPAKQNPEYSNNDSIEVVAHKESLKHEKMLQLWNLKKPGLFLYFAKAFSATSH